MEGSTIQGRNEKYTVVAGPRPSEASRMLKSALESGALVIAAGRCSTEYEGRASSTSTEGDRLLIVKPDGSVIIHGPKGFRPLNWQPSTSHMEVSNDGEVVVMKFLRRRPREVLVVKCSEIGFVALVESPEEGGFWMYMSEDELRKAIMENPQELLGEEIRFIKSEKRAPGGRADIYGLDSKGRIVLIEVKRVKADEAAVRQLESYVKEYPTIGRIRGILVAPDITEGARRLVEKLGLEYRRIDLRKAYMLVPRRRGKSVLDFIAGED